MPQIIYNVNDDLKVFNQLIIIPDYLEHTEQKLRLQK